MSLSAKERILRLREAQHRLQKLQHDLIHGERSTVVSAADFLAHHKELMALPGSNKDSVPFRFDFEAGKRYADIPVEQRLTLPPKVNISSINRFRTYHNHRDPLDESEQLILRNSPGFTKHPSLALQTFLNELDKQSAKLAAGFPKLDKALLSKSKYAKSIQPLNSKRYVQAATASKPVRLRSKIPLMMGQRDLLVPVDHNDVSSLSTSFLFLRSNLEDSPKVNPEFSRKGSRVDSKSSKYIPAADVSKIASATASVLLATQSISSGSKLSIPANAASPASKLTSTHNTIDLLQRVNETVRLKKGLAYGLGSANLMGVILPQKGASRRRSGPYPWDLFPSGLALEEGENNMTAKDALTLLRRRKLPQRKVNLPPPPSPQERGLIGVEISEFEPQCSYFFRDRMGNYNPHLHHSKNVTESLKKMQFQLESSKSTILKPSA